ncbi:MAG: aldo/keto reductase [Oscillospiraceae bacterium]|jgi:aryl-alcohol dehydrogenase-like predicted oxidoreductase|nr:aldo/keto reductase [Oscillospiraceae bacterium]
MALGTIEIAPGMAFSDIALGAGKRGIPAFREETFQIMDRYVDVYGGNCFDSAHLYEDGESDKALGAWLRRRGAGQRHSLFICTKGSHPTPGQMHMPRLSAAEIAADLDAALSDIGTEYADLHMVHRDDVRIPVSDIVPALDALVKSGKARHVGVSNWTATRIIEANRFARQNNLSPLRCCQMHFSLGITTAPTTGDITHVPMNDVEFGWYKESGFPIMAFCAQARGFFSVLAAGREPSERQRKYYDLLPENHRRLERLIKLSGELGVAPSAVCIAYVRDNAVRATALCAFSSLAQMEESMRAAEIRLAPQQVRYLETGE